MQYTRDVGGQDPQTVAVGLGKDYHYIQDPRGLRLYDYRLRRIYSVDPDHHFTNDSLYAEVWFRVSELDNRVRLRKMMQAGGLPLDKDPVQRGDLAGRTRWVVGDAEVAAVRFDAEPVPEALRGGLRRLWGTVVHLHPLIADDLAASGKMPQELWITTQRMGQDPVVIHWQLTSRRWQAQAHYPLPAHLTALPVPPGPRVCTRRFLRCCPARSRIMRFRLRKTSMPPARKPPSIAARGSRRCCC